MCVGRNDSMGNCRFGGKPLDLHHRLIAAIGASGQLGVINKLLAA